MIVRYSRNEIVKIWEEKNKYQIWLAIEIAAAQAMEKLKLIPKGVASKVKKKAKINVDRIQKIENKVHHDVIAFLTSITEKVGDEGKFLHYGMTSSDVLDTSFNIQLVQASKIISKDIDEADQDLFIDIIFSPIYFNILIKPQSLTKEYIENMLNIALKAYDI